MVFDIDHIRYMYDKDMKETYMRACFHGVDWPLEYRSTPDNSFNENNAGKWCGEGRLKLEETMYSGVFKPRL
jgi:hypothetical protein